MSWSNVKLILVREVRDQLRDRRTLFMIFVLPLLLYPLLGMSIFQVAQFVREQETRVLLVGAEQLPETPPLIDGDRFAATFFDDPKEARLLELELAPLDTTGGKPPGLPHEIEQQLRDGQFEAIVYFPPEFASRLTAIRQALTLRRTTGGANADALLPDVPSPEIYHNSAQEKSEIAYARVATVLSRWRTAIGRENLEMAGVVASAATPFKLDAFDVAEEGLRDAAIWSKIFPFLLLIWALTGAFYPAIDLCAGEKERGTLETLLCSPAERSEIVWGKLLTVMLFSMATVIFNIASMCATGVFILSKLDAFGPPPLTSLLWLLVALVPVSAMFSAVCLALAAFARSSKEGQYYLAPLILVTMPLAVLPMAPGVELNLGNSLIPVTGIVLLLKTVLEGNYWQALPFLPPVVLVTLGCCLFAFRWAVVQFNTESVLFREGERGGLGIWLKHMMRYRGDTPSVAAAVCCGVLILLIRFFFSLDFAQRGFEAGSFEQFAVVALMTQLVVIATPALLMTVMLTRSPRKTLLLNWPRFATVPLAVLLAVALHPVVVGLQVVVMWLYPISDEVASQLESLLSDSGSIWQWLIVIALVPAVCEELAFRGFILSGFRHLGNKWRAIILSSILFGMAHAIFQQSLVACLVGVVIGYLAVQSGSLFPCIAFHAVHNALGLVTSRINADFVAEYPRLKWLFMEIEGGWIYNWPLIGAGAVLALLLLSRLRRLPYAKTSEEVLQEAIDHQAAHVAAG